MADNAPSRECLLLIDDEPGIRRMMSLDLSADGYEVFTAEDGQCGLELFDQQEPRIVLTDLKMPGIDGIEVLRRIKERSPDTEVIVITGHGDLELAIRSLQLKAGDFITKPINNQALEVALERAAERLRLKDELRAYTQNLEERVAEATARVVKSERLAAVGGTVSALVHSLKNMLAGLNGGIYLVKQGARGQKAELQGRGLEMLERNISRVKYLVSNLLTLAKPRLPELEPQDAVRLAAEALDALTSEARNQEVALELKRPSEKLSLQCDPKAVIDSLCNLLSNAIDAAATVTGGRVELAVSQSGGEVIFAVSDNGPGLDPEAEAHIFKGFFSTKGASGTGLGLMVAQKNAQEHGGRVEHSNNPGKGVTFRLVLPMGQGRKTPAQEGG